jgi:hypothetical protein
MSRYTKGQTGNSRGRPKGTPNRTTAEAKELLNSILFSELDYIRAALTKVRTKDSYRYLELMSRLLAYVLPKSQAIDLNMNFEQLSDEQMLQLCNTLLRHETNER